MQVANLQQQQTNNDVKDDGGEQLLTKRLAHS